MEPELIALDWGTSSLRAFLMARGQVLVECHSNHGIQHLPQSGRVGFERAFESVAADWLKRWPHLPVLASGMVGSAHGWCEAPYVRCPADTKALIEHCVSVQSGLGPSIMIAPGVLYDQIDELPDVMRGEETQIAGALLMNQAWAERSCIVLPGTHSKWVQVQNGKITRYATYMTGELFDVLRRHSTLARVLPEPGSIPDVDPEVKAQAFLLGVSTARNSVPGALLHELFATRAMGLTNHFPSGGLLEYLSGLLIAYELIAGRATAGNLDGVPVILIGDPALCARYQHASECLGPRLDLVLNNSAPVGLWMLAQTAGLVKTLDT